MTLRGTTLTAAHALVGALHKRTNADTPPLAVEGCVDNDERRPVYVLVAASYAEARCPRLGRTELL